MRPLVPVLCFTAFALLAACGNDGVVTDPKPVVDKYPDPLASLDDVGRDYVIDNLERSCEELNYGEYEHLIHAAYVFLVDPAEVDIIGKMELDADQDLESTFAMFSGEYGEEPILNPVTGLPTGEHDPVPPVQSIRIDLIPVRSSEWTEMEDGDFKGSWRRIYEVDLTVTYSGDSRIDQIRGMQIFYVQPGTLRGDVSGTLYWQLRGWEDQGINARAFVGDIGAATRAPTEATSMSSLKTTF